MPVVLGFGVLMLDMRPFPQVRNMTLFLIKESLFTESVLFDQVGGIIPTQEIWHNHVCGAFFIQLYCIFYPV